MPCTTHVTTPQWDRSNLSNHLSKRSSSLSSPPCVECSVLVGTPPEANTYESNSLSAYTTNRFCSSYLSNESSATGSYEPYIDHINASGVLTIVMIDNGQHCVKTCFHIHDGADPLTNDAAWVKRKRNLRAKEKAGTVKSINNWVEP